ncbi:MAG: glutathione S-transferase family protein [Cohaesibacter sp.]|jgi:glutathione S-transferase|nr:glutathione S-transferase family protein [Cohaesibacter sp.]
MIILRSSPPSPFGRKTKIAAKLLGLYDQITVENGDTKDPSDSLRNQNPLGKIPILIMEDGETIYDSSVILDSLDRMAGGGKIIPEGDENRRKALTLQALADGIMDASILCVYETRMRPENERSPAWVDYQSEKVDRALTYLEQNAPALENGINVGHISLACALGYRDLRFGKNWRESYPNLASWLEDFAAKVPAFEATKFEG